MDNVPFKLHDKKFIHEADIIPDMEPVPQGEKAECSELADILISCNPDAR